MQEEFLKAYNEHSDALFRYCFFKVSDRDLAKDLLQETFTKTWVYIAGGGRVNNMKSFLYRTLSNLIVDEYRKKKMDSLDELADAGFEYGTNEVKYLHDQIDGREAIKILQKIGKSYRDVIFMKYVQELSIKEISEIAGESTNAVTVRIHRGLVMARKIFNHKNEK